MRAMAKSKPSPYITARTEALALEAEDMQPLDRLPRAGGRGPTVLRRHARRTDELAAGYREDGARKGPRTPRMAIFTTASNPPPPQKNPLTL